MNGLGQHIEHAQNFIAQVDAQHARDAAHESAMSSGVRRCQALSPDEQRGELCKAKRVRGMTRNMIYHNDFGWRLEK